MKYLTYLILILTLTSCDISPTKYTVEEVDDFSVSLTKNIKKNSDSQLFVSIVDDIFYIQETLGIDTTSNQLTSRVIYKCEATNSNDLITMPFGLFMTMFLMVIIGCVSIIEIFRY